MSARKNVSLALQAINESERAIRLIIMAVVCYTAVGHFNGPQEGISTDKIPLTWELSLIPRDCQSGALTTGPPQQACFGPVKLRTDSNRHSILVTLDRPKLISMEQL